MGNAANAAPYMGIISWIILDKTGEGIVLDVILGVVGAIVGGYLFSLLGAQGVTGLNLRSLLVAVIGAIVVIMVYRLIVGGGRLSGP